MDEKQIRQIVQQEIQRSNSASRFAVNNIPNHTHDGVNSPQIKAENVIPASSITGSITFATIQEYKIQLNSSFTPRNIQVYGIVTGNDGGVVRAITIGSAQLTPTFYLQDPNDANISDNYVVTGNLQYPFQNKPAQSSCYLSTNRTLVSSTFALVSEDHICSVTYNSVIWARATVTNFSKSSITIDVPYLEDGWEMILNFVIT